MKQLILAALAMTATADKHPASSVFAKQQLVITEMNLLYPDVKVDVRWVPCGEENSGYMPLLKTIYLCTEMEVDASTALVFAAHEFGHAITEQRLGIGDEQSADELAALSLVELGYQQELLDAAVYLKSQAEQDHIPGDPHPSNAYRAWEFACIEAGSEPQTAFSVASADCVDLYHGLRVRWERRLAQP